MLGFESGEHKQLYLFGNGSKTGLVFMRQTVRCVCGNRSLLRNTEGFKWNSIWVDETSAPGAAHKATNVVSVFFVSSEGTFECVTEKGN